MRSLTTHLVAVSLVGLASGGFGASGAAAPQPLPDLAQPPATIYHIAPLRSELLLLVYRSGPLGALGHNHVIATSDIRGAIAVRPNAVLSGFDLQIPVASFSVDAPALRATQGAAFEGQPSAEDRAGTRQHMLGPVLDAQRYPEIRLRLVGVEGTARNRIIGVRVSLHGVTRELEVPTQVVRQAGGDWRVSGAVSFKQSLFGIHPYSALFGALRVQDRMQAKFRFYLVPGGS